nr:xylan 1,4-beta-xylosidase [Streptacidiphilus fuscans]
MGGLVGPRRTAMRPRPRHWAAVLAVVVALGCLVALLHTGTGGGQPAWPPGTSDLTPDWGFTHTQYSADDGDASAEAAVRREVGAVPPAQDQALMGWGADNPEPSPGVYDFSRLDARIALITGSGGRPVITLCCAPDWMKGGQAGRTDWNQLETAPSPAHFADFAALAATVARRYPQVHDFLVWNEFKGFFDNTTGGWDAASYTALYNDVYRALKAVRPDILVGGPYLPVDSYPTGTATYPSTVSGPWGTVDERAVDAFRYWLAHNAGADFVVVDGSSLPKDGGSGVDAFAATAKFSAVTRWVHSLTPLPVWWSEWYVEPPDSGWTEPHRDAVLAAGMMALAQGGVAAAFYWNPETPSGPCPGCLWDRSGQALPPLTLLQGFARWFPPRTQAVPLATGNPDVLALAQPAEGVAVNTADRPVSVVLDGRTRTLGPYQVLWFSR